MDATGLVDALKKGADFIEALSPVAAAIGGPTVGHVFNVVGMVGEIAENIETRVKEGSLVLASEDQDEIKAVIARLAIENDKLAVKIASS